MMLDMKQAWDEMIIKLAPPDRREKIFANRFYKSLSTSLAGSQEYIAMQKLVELRTEREYDLIVLDTPPTAHALDFLEGPSRVLDFLDNEAARWLLTPALAAGKVGLELFSAGGGYVTKTLAKFTGSEVLHDLAQLLLDLSGLNESIRRSARQVQELLGSSETGFVLVAGPARDRKDEVAQFHAVLRQSRMRVEALVVNRVHRAPDPAEGTAAAALPSPLREKMLRTLEEAQTAAGFDAAGRIELQALCQPTPVLEVPRFDRDVHDIRALAETATYLAG